MSEVTNRYLIEDSMMGWIIDSNHLVDALIARAGDTDEVIAIMQRRYNAAYQTVLALRQRMDALEDRVREATQPTPVSEIVSEGGKYHLLTEGYLQQDDQWLGVRGWVAVDYAWWGAPVPHEWHCRRPIPQKPA